MKRFLSAALALAMAASALAGCSGTSSRGTAGGPVQTSGAAQVTPMSAATETLKAPKYVFLFIGDGMSYPQFQAASDYLGAMADPDYLLAQPSLDDNQGCLLYTSRCV